MKTTLQYIDAIKLRHGIESDYAVAKLLGTSRQAVSKYRQGNTSFDDLTALHVAELLGVNPLEVIAAANAERAKNDDARRTWTGLWDRLAVGFEVLLSLADQRRSPALA